MSIRTSFNPMGTLGAGGYISDGLVLCVLSEREGAGDSLTNLVDGIVYQSIAHTKTVSGALNFVGTQASILPRGAIPFSPENSIELIAHVKSGSVLFDCYLEQHDATGGKATVTAEYGQVSRNTSNDANAWRSHLGMDFFDKAYHYCLNSDDFDPVLVNAADVSVITDRHSWTSSKVSAMSLYLSTNVDIFAIRIYNRALTRTEIEHNYKLDKMKYKP